MASKSETVAIALRFMLENMDEDLTRTLQVNGAITDKKEIESLTVEFEDGEAVVYNP